MPDNADAAANAGTLYVFFHGLFSFVESPNGVDALLPIMPEHSYRAGEFLGETLLQQRPDFEPYLLSGVQGGPGRFDLTTNLVLQDAPPPKPRLSSSELHCKISLPTPLRTFSFRQVNLKNFLSDPTIFSNTVVSLLPVFQYSFNAVGEIQLGDHEFTMSSQDFGGHPFASLHIFSEEDAAVAFKHPRDGFTASLNMFVSLKRQCVLNDEPGKLPSVDPNDVLPGTILPEYEDLHFRTENRLALLGRKMRSGNWPASWDEGNPPFGDSVGSCTNVVSSGN